MNWNSVTLNDYDRKAVARQMLDDAIYYNSIQCWVEQAIENIEKTHAVGSPKWRALMRLLEGDICYEMARMDAGVVVSRRCESTMLYER